MYSIISYNVLMCELLLITKCIDCGSLFLMRHTTHSDLVEDYYYYNYNFIFFWHLLMAQTQLFRRRRRELHSLMAHSRHTVLQPE